MISPLIHSQIFNFAVMAVSGALFALIFQIAAFFRHRLQLKPFTATVLELMLWVIQALIAANFLYYCSFGKWTIECFLGAVTGLILWRKIIYGIMALR